MTLLKRKRLLAAKIETTSGTAETLAAADAAFNTYDVMIQQNIEMTTRESTGGFGTLASVPGGYQGKVTFKTDWAWDGTATEPAWADTFFPACGVTKSVNTFAPKTEVPGSNVKTLTIGVYIDGMLKRLRGCAGTFKIVCPTGRMVTTEWEFTGIWDTPTDVAILSPTYPTDLPLRYANGVTTWQSYALAVENITFDVGNEITLRESATSVAGYAAALITNRVPKISCNPESKLVAAQDRFGQLLAMSEGSFVWEIKGPGTSKVVITAPKAGITNIQEADRNKLTVDQLELQCNRNGSTQDSEFSIVFTP